MLNDDERRRLVEEHAGYARALAGQIRERLRPSVDMDDLVAYGMQGLMEAASRYDPRHGVRFTTYAYYRIRGSIFDGLRSMGWINRTLYARIRFEERANSYLQGLGDSSQPNAGLAEFSRAMDDLAAIYVTSLDAMDRPLPDGAASSAHESAELGELRDRLRAAVDTLPARERKLVRLYYYGEKTLEETGRQLGLSKSWTSRLHARAVGRLGRMLRGEEPSSRERGEERRASPPNERRARRAARR